MQSHIEARWKIYIPPTAEGAQSKSSTSTIFTQQYPVLQDLSVNSAIELSTARALLQANQHRKEIGGSGGKKIKPEAFQRFTMRQAPLWPLYDTLQSCRNNVLILEGLVSAFVVTHLENLLHLTRIIIDQLPHLYFDAVPASLMAINVESVRQVKLMLEHLADTRKKHQQQKKDTYDSKKPLIEQDTQECTQLVTRMIQVGSEANNYLRFNSASVLVLARLICGQLPSTIDKILIAGKYK